MCICTVTLFVWLPVAGVVFSHFTRIIVKYCYRLNFQLDGKQFSDDRLLLPSNRCTGIFRKLPIKMFQFRKTNQLQNGGIYAVQVSMRMTRDKGFAMRNGKCS